MLYCKAKFGTGFLGRGAGFGNRLFPWARCRIFSEMHNAKTVSPVWLRPAMGQLFRGGIDYKNYFRQLILWGLFKRRIGDLRVIHGNLKICRMTQFPEPKELSSLPQGLNRHLDVKIIFKNFSTDNFQPLNGWSEFLLAELRMITKPKYLSRIDSFKSIPIGMVVRCGNDFQQPALNGTHLKFGEKTPISWFIAMLYLIRSIIGKEVHAYVVSDGTTNQLAELLAVKNVYFVKPGAAISDLLTISRATILLASGSSSFAAWACFLGQMVSASHLGQPLTDWKILSPKGKFMGEVDPLNPPADFISQVKLLPMEGL